MLAKQLETSFETISLFLEEKGTIMLTSRARMQAPVFRGHCGANLYVLCG
jgi:hypothetical protein